MLISTLECHVVICILWDTVKRLLLLGLQMSRGGSARGTGITSQRTETAIATGANPLIASP